MASTTMLPTGEHVRDNSSFLAEPERRALVAMAERMPAAINSDHLTVLGLLAMWAAGACLALTPYFAAGPLLAIVCLAVNWFGDSLDGTVARVRGHQRPRYGFYVDHVVDVFGSAGLFAGLAVSGIMSPWVAALLLIAYLMLTTEIFLATHTVGRFQLSYWRFGPTELRILLAIGLARAWLDPTVVIAGRERLLFDIGGVIGAAGILFTMVVSTVRNTRTLYRAEPLP